MGGPMQMQPLQQPMQQPMNSPLRLSGPQQLPLNDYGSQGVSSFNQQPGFGGYSTQPAQQPQQHPPYFQQPLQQSASPYHTGSTSPQRFPSNDGYTPQNPLQGRFSSGNEAPIHNNYMVYTSNPEQQGGLRTSGSSNQVGAGSSSAMGYSATSGLNAYTSLRPGEPYASQQQNTATLSSSNSTQAAYSSNAPATPLSYSSSASTPTSYASTTAPPPAHNSTTAAPPSYSSSSGDNIGDVSNSSLEYSSGTSSLPSPLMAYDSTRSSDAYSVDSSTVDATADEPEISLYSQHRSNVDMEQVKIVNVRPSLLFAVESISQCMNDSP